MLIGIRVQDDDFVAARAKFGPADLGRVFVSGELPATVRAADLVARLDRVCAPVRAAGMIPFVSFKPRPTDVAGGRFDPHFRVVAEWIRSGGLPVWLTVWHEPENDMRGPRFVATYTRAYRAMKAVAGDLLCMGPVYMAYQWRSASATTANAVAWKVGLGDRDFRGLDIYSALWSGPQLSLDEKPEFHRWDQAIGGGPVVIAERGIADGTGQADTLFADYAYLSGRSDVLAYCYWHSGGATDDSVFLLNSDARTRFAAIIHDAHAADPPAGPGDGFTAVAEGLSCDLCGALVARERAGRHLGWHPVAAARAGGP